MNSKTYLRLDSFPYPRSSELVCCLCGTWDATAHYRLGVLLDDVDSGKDESFMCAECAYKFWYDHLVPSSNWCLNHLLYDVLHASFFGDRMTVYDLTEEDCSLDPETCHNTAKEILRSHPNQNVCILFPEPFHELFHLSNNRVMLFSLRESQPQSYWLLSGYTKELFSFIMALRWMHYRCREAKITGCTLTVLDKGASWRFEVVVFPKDDHLNPVSFIHYGHIGCRYYALGGTLFYLKQHGVEDIEVTGIPMKDVAPEPLGNLHDLPKRLQDMLKPNP